MGMLFRLDPVTAPKQPAGPCEEDILKDLVKIVKALYPLTHMSNDPDDRRPLTNCVLYTRYTGGGYLVGTDSHCLVAVKLTDSQAQFMDSEDGRAALANKCRLRWDKGAFLDAAKVKGEAYLFGSPSWKSDSGCWGADQAYVPYWPALIPTGYLTPDGRAPFDASLGAKVDQAVNAIRAVYGDSEIATGICPRMIGDSKNLTTGRVWCENNILALVMPIRMNGTETSREDVRNFVAQASRV